MTPRPATSAVSLLLALAAAGCSSGDDAPPRADQSVTDADLDLLGVRRDAAAALDPAGDLRPAAVLEPGDLGGLVAFPLNSDARVRLDVVRDGRDGRADRRETLVEADVPGGALLRLSTDGGLVAGRRVLLAGPLDRGATHELYLLPPGGVANEAGRVVTGATTPEQRAAERARRRDAARDLPEPTDVTADPAGAMGTNRETD